MMSRFYVFIVLCCCLSPVWADEEPTVLITGANRGIGLEIARIYADRNWNVIATARKPEAAKDLVSLLYLCRYAWAIRAPCAPGEKSPYTA